jgi:hypothetical protein
MDPKVFRCSDMLIGFSGSYRIGQALRFRMPDLVPPRDGAEDLYRWMVVEFVEAVRACLKSAGVAKIDNSVETHASSFLVATRGRLFRVEQDFQVGYVATGYDAVGCGEDLARGALHALDPFEMAPRARIRAALEAAQAWNAGVRAPFIVVEMRCKR